MSTTTKEQIWPGSRLILHTVDTERDTAISVMEVSGVGGTAGVFTSNDIAIAHVKANHPFYANTNIPLDSATSVKVSQDVCRVTAKYKFPALVTFNRNSSEVFDRAIISSGSGKQKWYKNVDSAGDPGTPTYDGYGRPAGHINGLSFTGTTTIITDGTIKPVAWYRTYHYITITATAVLDYNATEDVFPLLDQCNSDTISWGGITFTANKVMFVGFRSERLPSVDGDKWRITYNFNARPDTWEEQEVKWKDNTKWVTNESMPGQTTTFGNGAFPT